VAEEITTARLRAAVTHHQAGRIHEAAALYAAVLADQPHNADALHLLGLAKHQTGDSDQGIDLIRQAIRLNPSAQEFHANLAGVFAAMKRLPEAVESMRRAASLRPNELAIQWGLAKYLVRLGVSLIDQDCPAEALAVLEEAVRAKPDFAEALANAGVALLRLKRYDRAVQQFQQALALKPNIAAVHTNLGAALLALGRVEEAVAAHRRACALKPDWLAAKTNLAIALAQVGESDEALALHDEVLRTQPENPTALFNRGVIRLSRGDFTGGWADYEARFRVAELKGQQSFPQPRWSNIVGDVSGKTILVHAEQGLGDTVQFVRYVPQIIARGANLIVQCDPLLLRLLSHSLPGAQVVPRGHPLPAFDLHVPVMSLPHAFGTTLKTIPSQVPYLTAPPACVEKLSRRLGPRGGTALGVGLVWSGNPGHYNDHNRSIPFATLIGGLAHVPGVRWFSLQKGPGAEQLSPLQSRFDVTDLAPDLDDLADSAAAIGLLDVIVSVDTSIAHLAGALGAATWTLLPTPPDFRWMTGRDDSPWYPTMRLFRQPRAGDWDAVIESVAAQLAREAERLARAENP
jgi:tetratricopeptide (TPR) repeat protein